MSPPGDLWVRLCSVSGSLVRDLLGRELFPPCRWASCLSRCCWFRLSLWPCLLTMSGAWGCHGPRCGASRPLSEGAASPTLWLCFQECSPQPSWGMGLRRVRSTSLDLANHGVGLLFSALVISSVPALPRAVLVTREPCGSPIVETGLVVGGQVQPGPAQGGQGRPCCQYSGIRAQPRSQLCGGDSRVCGRALHCTQPGTCCSEGGPAEWAGSPRHTGAAHAECRAQEQEGR